MKRRLLGSKGSSMLLAGGTPGVFAGSRQLVTSMPAALGSGLVGIGRGEFNTPSMVPRSRISLRIAAATSILVMALTVFAGASTHALLGRPVWRLAV